MIVILNPQVIKQDNDMIKACIVIHIPANTECSPNVPVWFLFDYFLGGTK